MSPDERTQHSRNDIYPDSGVRARAHRFAEVVAVGLEHGGLLVPLRLDADAMGVGGVAGRRRLVDAADGRRHRWPALTANIVEFGFHF